METISGPLPLHRLRVHRLLQPQPEREHDPGSRPGGGEGGGVVDIPGAGRDLMVQVTLAEIQPNDHLRTT